MDLTDAVANGQSAEACATAIRERIRAATGLTASVGLAPTFLAAKIAADVNKPNGQYLVQDVVPQRGLRSCAAPVPQGPVHVLASSEVRQTSKSR